MSREASMGAEGSAAAAHAVPPPTEDARVRGLLRLDPAAAAKARSSRSRVSQRLPRTPRFETCSRAQSLHEAQSLEHELEELRSAMDTEVSGISACVDLFYFQRRYMHAAVTLLELLQRDGQRAHARQLPEVHSVLQRMFSTGIAKPLDRLSEALMHCEGPAGAVARAPADPSTALASHAVVLELLRSMLSDTYALCACLYEMATELRVQRASVEWLGYLACRLLRFLRYAHVVGADGSGHTLLTTPLAPRMHGIRSLYEEECDAWKVAAFRWYGITVRDAPGEGRLYTSLAQLSAADSLQALYFYSKSAMAVTPGRDVAADLVAMCTPTAQAQRVRIEAPLLDLFVYECGVIATRTQLEHFLPILSRIYTHFLPTPDGHPLALSGTHYPHILLETEWAMLGVCCVAAVLEFGRADAYIDARWLASNQTPSDVRPFSAGAGAVLSAFAATRHASPQDTSHPEPLNAHGMLDVALAAGIPEAPASALTMLMQLLHAAVDMLHEALANPVAHINSPTAFLGIVLSFLQVLTLRQEHAPVAAVCRVLRGAMPWRRLSDYARGDVFGTAQCPPETLERYASAELPIDWCLRGLAWNSCTPPTCTPIASGPNLFAFSFASETTMLADLGAISRHFASLKTYSYLAAYMQDPDLQLLLKIWHTRTMLLTALVHKQLETDT